VLSSCLVGVALSKALGLDDRERRDVYYLSLLRHIGCTATADAEASLFGNELHMADALTVDPKNMGQALRFMLRTAGRDQPLLRRAFARERSGRLIDPAIVERPIEQVFAYVGSPRDLATIRDGFCRGQAAQRWREAGWFDLPVKLTFSGNERSHSAPPSVSQAPQEFGLPCYCNDPLPIS
jgi:hypothetical protein